MKATELMIGDWVRCTDPKPFRIDQIDGIDEVVYSDDDFWIDAETLQPIPLTVEILDKNCEHIRTWYGKSFEWTWYNEENGSYIELSSRACEDDFFFSVNGGEYYLFKITYVHELQHALRLCGIEKEVVL